MIKAKPKKSQLEWSDAEIGVIIHFDMQVFEPDYSFREQWGYTPSPEIFNPKELDTDQWIKTAVAAGAKYAILVAKHCSGFSLWPTKAHDYHIGNTPWKDGKGDIVADFFNSCRKYNVKPGLYCSAATNAYLNVDNPGKVRTGKQDQQKDYNRIVVTQLTELWSNYGPLLEIWFDGGLLPPEQGGPEGIEQLLKRLQPNAVVFQGPQNWPALLRWGGNERAEPPDPCWSATSLLTQSDGTVEDFHPGNPDGEVWAPAEADMPNRDQNKAFQSGWFWRKGDEKFLYPVNHLVECYLRSVGKNTNLLLGMVIDDRGMVPKEDQEQFAEFGKRVRQIFSNPIQASVSKMDQDKTFYLELPEPQELNLIALQENIKYGERVRKYIVEARQKDGWLTLCRGTVIGHKRIERFAPITTAEIRLRIQESAGQPEIRDISVWNADPALFGSPMDPVLLNEPIISRDKTNFIHIRCGNPNMLIRYTTDGSEPNASSMLFDKPFILPGQEMIKAYSFINERSNSQTTTALFGLDRSQWKIEHVSMESPFMNNGHADSLHLLNDDPEYYWHTYHTDQDISKPPHELIINMNETLTIKAFTVTLFDIEGCPGDCEFQLSDDGEIWHSAARTTFADVNKFPSQQTIPLDKALHGRFIRLIVKTAAENFNYVKISGIGVLC